MFAPLRPVLRQVHEGLAIGLTAAGWALAVLAALLLARREWMVAMVAALGAVPFVVLPRWRARVELFALVAVSLPLFLATAEVVIRLKYFGMDALVTPARYQPIGAMDDPTYLAAAPEPGVVYTLRPGFDGWVKGVRVTANSRGVREREVSGPPPPGVLRILTLGTSVTMGEGVAAEQTFTRVLARRLDRQGIAVDALNFGVGGYALGTSQALLEARGLDVRPAIVIQELAVSVLNESERTIEALRTAFLATQANPPRVSFFETHSFALQAIYPPISLRKRLDGLAGPRQAAASPRWDYLERSLDRFAQLAASRHFRGVIFVPRPLHSFGTPRLHRAERHRIRQLVEARGLVFVDSYGRFTAADRAEDFVIFPGELHPNARGHARHAEALAAALVPLLRMPPRP